MSNNANNNSKNQDSNGNFYVTTSGGNKNAPRQIHVAHRRTQSELTNLMIEQLTLQKQLEAVQQQQQQLLYQQQQQYPSNTSYIPPNPHYGNQSIPGSSGSRSRTHSRNNSSYYHENTNNPNNASSHRRTGSQSSVYGHSRRHSLGLNEAKKAAAEEQAKRIAGTETPTFLVPSINYNNQEYSSPRSTSVDEQSSFKFPPPASSNNGNSPNYEHRYSSSNLSPSSFKFPASGNNNNNNNTNMNTNKVNEFSSPGINSNWRTQQQQSPFRHRSSNSRDFANTLQQPAFFPGHKQRNSNSSVASTNSNQNSNNNRKSLFAPYLPQANIPQLIEEGRLVAGILRVNKKNRSDAWVSTEGTLDADIYICGSKDRNRALEGDLVAVELLVVDDVWDSKKEKEEKKRRKDASTQHDLISLSSNDDYHNDASATTSTTGKVVDDFKNSDDGFLSPTKPLGGGFMVKRKNSLKQRPTQKKNDDVEVEGQSLLLVEEEEINDQYKPLYAGHVVAVLDRIPGQLFSGTLGLLRPSQQQQQQQQSQLHSNDSAVPQNKPKIAWFKPTDKKVPLIAIPTELAPKDFVENADKYADKLFVASIKRWPITSLHPFGILVSELGEINDPNTEIDSILRDNNFLSNEYSDPRDPRREKSNLQAIPISSENYSKRRFFTPERGYDDVLALTFNNSLSDFAIHIKEIDADRIELGCHVVDVTAHIEEGSSLDKRARKRSTSVFMPQKTVDLLPQLLNEFLTLKPGNEAATISVVYTLDAETMKIKSTWIGETIISPSNIMDVQEFDDDITAPSIRLVERIATAFYHERMGFDDINLLPSLSLFETLDDEKTKVDLNIMDRSLGFLIINEIQRKVNATVAETLYSKLGDSSFLRRGAQPTVTKMATFEKKMKKLGYEVDVSSSDTVLRSILAIKDDDARIGAEVLLFKTMSRAKYFVAGKADPDQYGHYALNLPIYAHFTCPLRRYADHVVHRQLKSIINGIPYNEDIDSLKITAEYCNFKKDCSYQAQEQAIHLLLCKTINDMGDKTGQILTMATVLQVYESSFDVIIPEFGIEKRVHGDQLPLIKAEFDGLNKVLELHWQPGVDSATFIPADEKNPKSYRNSIKNKFKSTSEEIASLESSRLKDPAIFGEELSSELSKLHLTEPKLRLPESLRKDAKGSVLDKFISTTVTRKENENCIQEIRELQKVPILLRAEIGMALPCLSVRALNPFMRRGA
ncbi:hypothetical protein KAFR_0E01390 [Kazachstania africana CBS 2517]|uniref:RNB domain-containing protein n=1 Tax=Kazachstania africana (strain ATCC 22294 / BCRC 22015 / CBS 2517 / CECT 1963 / NBRC 1671 / NRRL Y-8276) TaxID=1071382 RepID=H2AV93_KAZAF|nr:hypothetical protein KAFR_0E01390 [Kazachstania africana CBS 2517]CCF58293.1 hypothetical protein KAFR_0E01390 [Kazachstania africana CBS 2517]